MDDEPPWTGALTCPVVDGQGEPSGAIEFVLERDFVTAWIGDRTLAVIDRQRLHDWFADPQTPFQRHDLTLAAIDGWIGVVVADGPAEWLAIEGAVRLIATV